MNYASRFIFLLTACIAVGCGAATTTMPSPVFQQPGPIAASTDVAVVGDTPYVAFIGAAGGAPAAVHVRAYDGTTWTAVGGGPVDTTVAATAVELSATDDELTVAYAHTDGAIRVRRTSIANPAWKPVADDLPANPALVRLRQDDSGTAYIAYLAAGSSIPSVAREAGFGWELVGSADPDTSASGGAAVSNVAFALASTTGGVQPHLAFDLPMPLENTQPENPSPPAFADHLVVLRWDGVWQVVVQAGVTAGVGTGVGTLGAVDLESFGDQLWTSYEFTAPVAKAGIKQYTATPDSWATVGNASPSGGRIAGWMGAAGGATNHELFATRVGPKPSGGVGIALLRLRIVGTPSEPATVTGWTTVASETKLTPNSTNVGGVAIEVVQGAAYISYIETAAGQENAVRLVIYK